MTEVKSNTPAAVRTNVWCPKCHCTVLAITFAPDGDVGVCACKWTSWHLTRRPGTYGADYTKALRSEVPLTGPVETQSVT